MTTGHARKGSRPQPQGGLYDGVLSFATIGLSRFDLTSATTGRSLHIELLLCLHQVIGERNVPAVLQQVGVTLLEAGRAIVRGDVIELDGNAIDGTSTTAFYATLPVYFDDDFATRRIEDGTDVAIVWMIPIHPSEHDLIRRHGWPAFEKLLQDQDPDLFDPTRPPLTPGRVSG